ncbi:hypothetical protein RSAG8_02486, partial [Rhizoctonia solani AG-8 WAC10335]
MVSCSRLILSSLLTKFVRPRNQSLLPSPYPSTLFVAVSGTPCLYYNHPQSLVDPYASSAHVACLGSRQQIGGDVVESVFIETGSATSITRISLKLQKWTTVDCSNLPD